MKGEVELRNPLCRRLPKSTGVVFVGDCRCSVFIGFHSAKDKKKDVGPPS